MKARLLLLSNSRSSDGAFLRWPKKAIQEFLTDRVREIHFLPHATLPATVAQYDSYTTRVRRAFADMGYGTVGLHETRDPATALRNAEAIAVGGGNTFQLLAQLYEKRLLDIIVERVNSGVPYIGWSAGANIACPTLATTNDMPIAQPPSFQALGLVPFQINPHYTDAHPPGHQGESRAARIAEFLLLNPTAVVIGLREGALIQYEEGEMHIVGSARIFRADGAAASPVGQPSRAPKRRLSP